MPPIESNTSFGPVELGYYPVGSGSHWFTKWFRRQPPARGFKIHVSPNVGDAEIVARSVLPKLRSLGIPHKVVRNLQLYRQLSTTHQGGKFITIYTSGAPEAQRVLEEIEPELRDLRRFGGLKPGTAPTTRESKHREAETPIGDTGLVFTRWYEEGDAD